jgi:PAS domain S-box-containing protein
VNRQILIIEDDPAFRDSIRLIFEDTSYALLEASTVNAGLRLLDEHDDIQVIILDLELPGKTGTDFLEKIKDRISNYRVIVLTAHGEQLMPETAKSYKVFSYLAKAEKSLRESLRFQVALAFEDIEKAWLRKKSDIHLEIGRKIRNLRLRKKEASDQDSKEVLDQGLKEVLDLICDYALDLIGAYTCHIRLFDAGKGDFVLWASRGRVPNAESIFSKRKLFSEPYSGIVADTKEALTIGDLQNDPPFKDMKESALNSGEIDEGFRQYLDDVQSARIVPISTGIFGDDIDGVFNINSDVKHFFDEAKLELVEDFVTQTAIVVTKHLLKEKRAEIHSDYKNISEMLGEVSDELKSEDELNEIYRIVCKRISIGLKPELISIFKFDEQAEVLKNVAEFRGDQWVGPSKEAYAPGVGLVGQVYSTSEPIRFTDKRENPYNQTEVEPLPDGYLQESIINIPSGRLSHYLGVPIRIGNDTIGVIRAVNKRSEHYNSEPEKTNSICLLKRGFSDDCQLELEIAASHLAVAIQNAELIGKLNKKVNQLEALHTVGNKIKYEMDMDALLNLIVSEAAQVMHAEICMLFLMDEKGDKVELTQSYGMPLFDAFYLRGEGNTGWVAETGKHIIEEQATDHVGKYDAQIIGFLRETQLLRMIVSLALTATVSAQQLLTSIGSMPAQSGMDEDTDIESFKGINSFMAAPIVGKGRILGVIKVINKVEAPFHFDADDFKLFEVFASQIGLERFLYTQRMIVDNSPDPIVFLDQKGRVKIFNKACEEFWGYKREEVLGESITKFYASETHARKIGKAIWESADKQIQNFPAEIKHKDGTFIPVNLSAAFWFDDKGERVGSMGVFKDLREMKRLQDQMLQSEKLTAIGKLAHTIGHDIKTKIATALNYIDVLLYECQREIETIRPIDTRKAEQVAIYTDVRSALWKAADKIKNLLMAAQPKPPKRDVIRLRDIFTEIHGPMSRQANSRHVEFAETLAHETREVFVDVEQIRQVLWNLFNNSLEAIDAKGAVDNLSWRGRIEVSASVNGNVMELTWKDDGYGIPEEALPRIFEPFYTKNKENGTGLGLYAVKEIVEGHGGTIRVESVKSQGACFRISIPVSVDSMPAG